MLPLEEDELAGLEPEELVQPVELAAVERERVLELVEPRFGGADVVLERLDLVRDDLDLRREDAFALTSGLDLRLQRVDLAIDGGLAVANPVCAARRQGREQKPTVKPATSTPVD